jgi:hypothetical protein
VLAAPALILTLVVVAPLARSGGGAAAAWTPMSSRRRGSCRSPAFDVDALVAYLAANSPLAPPPINRITKIG